MQKVNCSLRIQNEQYLHFWELTINQMYHRQQNKCYPQRCQIFRKLQLTPALYKKIDSSNKFDFYYYGQVNSSVASKWAS